MPNLPKITSILKSGSESLTENGAPLNNTILDFWRWSASDIISNSTRGRFAEFIVGAALGLDFKEVRDEWDSYDIATPEGVKVEVKSAAYIQSWWQDEYSNISFSIKPSTFYDDVKEEYVGPKRHADIYVFCLLTNKDTKTINPLNVDQWEFYIVRTSTLNEELGKDQKTVSLSVLKQLTSPVRFGELRDATLHR
jgi:hypothetical protein